MLTLGLGYPRTAVAVVDSYKLDSTRTANTTSSYVLWWELYPVNSGGSVQYTAGECSNSAVGTTSPGDILSLTITTYSSTWYFDTYDYNSTVSCSTSYSHSETPYYAQFIVEAPAYSSNLYISQIAKFSGPVNFEGAQVDIAYYGSTPDDVTNLYNNGWYQPIPAQPAHEQSQHTRKLLYEHRDLLYQYQRIPGSHLGKLKLQLGVCGQLARQPDFS